MFFTAWFTAQGTVKIEDIVQVLGWLFTHLDKRLFEAYAVVWGKKKQPLENLLYKLPVLAVAVQWWSGWAGWWWPFECRAVGSAVHPGPVQLLVAEPKWSSTVPALQELPPDASPPKDHTCIKIYHFVKPAWIIFVGVTIEVGRWINNWWNVSTAE